MIEYHDVEWGVPSRDDRHLYEHLVLEGAQAGLSWRTILHRREGYRQAFAGFEPEKVARFTVKRIDKLLQDPGIIRNRLKVESAVSNARCFLAVQAERGSFADYLWDFVGGEPVVHRYRTTSQIPVESPAAVALSKDLKKRGFRFVGPTSMYAFMQAVGMVNDHLVACYRHAELGRPGDG
jgi:DNA-3-methyladenine glycosylase I